MSSERPFHRRVLRNSVAGLAANVWAIAVALITLPLMVHGLGLANFGRWVLLQTMSASTGWLVVMDGGLAVAGTRLVSTRAAMARHEGTGSALGTTIATFVALGAVSAAICLALAWPVLEALGRIPADEVATARAAALLLSLQVAGEFVQQGAEACLEGLQRLDLSRGVDAVRRALFYGSTAAVAMSGGSLRTVELAAVAASALGALLGMAVLAAQRPPRLSLSAGDLREMLIYASKVVLLRPISAIYALMNRVIVGAVLGPAPVSAVEVATQLGNGANSVVAGITAALVPSSAWVDARGDRKKLTVTLLTGTRYALVLSWPLAAGVAMLATPGIRLWVGTVLAGTASRATQVAMAASVVTATGQVAGNILLGVGRGGVIVRVATVGVIVNLAASVALVYPLGVAGVFWGTLIAAAVTTPWIVVAACRYCDTHPRQFLAKAVAPPLVPLLAELAVLGFVDALGLRPAATLALGVPLGAVVAVGATLRWALPAGEVAGLWRSLRSGAGSAPTPDAPSDGMELR